MPTQFQFRVSEELEGGVYANIVNVWHTAFEFTLDFAATLPPSQVELEDGSAAVDVPCHITARVKVPPTLVFNLIQGINEQMTAYENRWGYIRRPDDPEPMYPPDDRPAGPPSENGGDGNTEGD